VQNENEVEDGGPVSKLKRAAQPRKLELKLKLAAQPRCRAAAKNSN